MTDQATILEEAATDAAATPQIAVASLNTVVGLQTFANANISNASNPTGSIAFDLFAPGDEVTPVFTSTDPLSGVSVNSKPFVTNRAGTWTWKARYAGDANNNPAVSAVPASIIVDKASSAMAVRASLVGGAMQATAELTGGFQPTGTITFSMTRDVAGTPPCTQGGVIFPPVPVNGAGAYQSPLFTPAQSGTYRWRATYSGDDNSRGVSTTPCFNPDAAVEVSLPTITTGRFHPVTPARILDTRAPGTVVVGSGITLDVQVAGRAGVPAAGAVAVAMNVTVTQPTATGFITVFPTGTAPPVAANLNFTPGKTVPNLVVAKLGAGGRVSLFNSAGSTHLVIDVAGWFSDVPVGNDGRFQPVVPTRVLDTRSAGTKLAPGASLDVQVTGPSGVPVTGAEAVVVNVAATNTTEVGFLTLHAAGEPRPLAANLNFGAADTASNRAVVKIGAGGRITVANGPGSADVIVDVCGWFTDGSQAGPGGVFAALVPARLLDTAAAGAAIPGPLTSGRTVDIQVAGQAGVPAAGATAAVLNVCAHSSTAGGFLTLFRPGTTKPTVSDLNFATGEVRPNLVIAPLDAAGRVSLFTSTACHVVIDVAGFFS